MKTRSAFPLDVLRSAESLAGFGRVETGATSAVRFVRVRVSDPDYFPRAILATYGGGKPVLINDSARIDQFLHRGC
jgi:hypothetical protein